VRLRILDRLLEAEEFEHFLAARFVVTSAFRSKAPRRPFRSSMDCLTAPSRAVFGKRLIGMAHRGRLTVLATITRKDLVQVFSEFEGNLDPQSVQGSGDVKYHLGATGTHRSPGGGELTVSVSPNPSHLEAVNPVVEGIVRPKQDRLGDAERAQVIPVLIHGDAAFAGRAWWRKR